MANIKDVTVKLNPYLGKCIDFKWWQSFTREWGNCELTRLNAGGYEHPNSLAIVTGTHGPARLGTSSDFGCVMHEGRADVDNDWLPVLEIQNVDTYGQLYAKRNRRNDEQTDTSRRRRLHVGKVITA